MKHIDNTGPDVTADVDGARIEFLWQTRGWDLLKAVLCGTVEDEASRAVGPVEEKKKNRSVKVRLTVEEEERGG